MGLLPHPLFLGFLFFWVIISPSSSVSAVTWLCSAQSPFILTRPSPLSLSCLVSESLSESLSLPTPLMFSSVSAFALEAPWMVTWAPPLSSPLPHRPGAAAAECREAAADGAGTGGAAAGGAAAAAAPAGARGGAEPAAAQPRSVGGAKRADLLRQAWGWGTGPGGALACRVGTLTSGGWPGTSVRATCTQAEGTMPEAPDSPYPHPPLSFLRKHVLAAA